MTAPENRNSWDDLFEDLGLPPDQPPTAPAAESPPPAAVSAPVEVEASPSRGRRRRPAPPASESEPAPPAPQTEGPIASRAETVEAVPPAAEFSEPAETHRAPPNRRLRKPRPKNPPRGVDRAAVAGDEVPRPPRREGKAKRSRNRRRPSRLKRPAPRKTRPFDRKRGRSRKAATGGAVAVRRAAASRGGRKSRAAPRTNRRKYRRKSRGKSWNRPPRTRWTTCPT